MKSITTFLTIILLGLMASTTAKASQLYLTTTSGTFTKINLSGQTFVSNNGDIVASHLRPGHHNLVVKQKWGRLRGRNARHGRSFRHSRTLYRGGIHIPPNSTVYARINRRGRLIIDQVVRHRPVRKVKVRKGRKVRRPQARRPRRGSNRTFNQSMNVEHFIMDLNRQAFESDKLEMAKDYVVYNELSSDQIAQITKTMDHESSKLVFAKFAYDHSTDPDNYLVVSKSFGHRSSTAALINYIS